MRQETTSEEGRKVKDKIREFDPFAAQVLAEYCEQLIRKKQNRLNISESVLLKSIEMQCSDEELVIERELAGVIRSAKRILEDTSETEWSEEHKQLFLLLKKIVFVGLDDENEQSDSDVINSVVDGLMRLDYSQEVPVFQVVEEERNIFNYFGFILDSLAQKFKESTVSSKAVNAFLNIEGSKAFFVTDAHGMIRFASQRLEQFLQRQTIELLDQPIHQFIPAWSEMNFENMISDKSDEEILLEVGIEGKTTEAYIQFDVAQGDEAFGDEEDEVKEYVVSIDFDTSRTDREEEIYNNLTSIDGVIDAVKSLKHGNVSPSEHNYSLQTSLESLYRIKYSQLDKLNQTEEFLNERIDPDTIVKSVLSELRFNVGFDAVSVNVNNDLSEGFLGDFETVYSILKHLISNAIKYRKTDVDSLIDVHFSGDNNYTKIEVVDNGIGMHEDDISQIFKKGYRASKSSEGYGLGLFFIQRCLARCNGSISVKSELTVGSKFTITLQH